MDDWHELLRQAEARLAAAGAPPTTPPVVSIPPMKEEWQREIVQRLEQSGYNLVIPLTSGQKIRVVRESKVGLPDPEGLVRISDHTMMSLAHHAVFLKGKVSRVVSKDQHTAEIKAIVDRGEGFWASPGVFVEVNKKESASSTPSDGIVAAPGNPEALPVLDPRPFLSISAGIVRESVPMRLPSGKVMGSLLKTVHGPLYVKNAGEADHRLHVGAEWANLGGYTIDEEIFRKYLGDPQTVIKVVRDKVLYFTTSEHVKRYAGVIRSWGAEKLVMPLRGNFWLVTNEQGLPLEVGS